MANMYNPGDPIGEIVFGSPIYPVRLFQTGSDENVVKMSGDLCGWSLTNVSTSASAKIDFTDGLDGNGLLIASITFNPSESVRDWYGPFGIRFKTGLFKLVVSGNVDGSVWLRL